MGEEIESLAKFVAETRWEDVPEGVRQHAKLVLLDTLGVILAGSGRPEVAELRQRLTASRGVGATVYANGWPEAESAHRGIAKRYCRTVDRVVRGAALCLGTGGNASIAGGIGGRRARQ